VYLHEQNNVILTHYSYIYTVYIYVYIYVSNIQGAQQGGVECPAGLTPGRVDPYVPMITAVQFLHCWLLEVSELMK